MAERACEFCKIPLTLGNGVRIDLAEKDGTDKGAFVLCCNDCSCQFLLFNVLRGNLK